MIAYFVECDDDDDEPLLLPPMMANPPMAPVGASRNEDAPPATDGAMRLDDPPAAADDPAIDGLSILEARSLRPLLPPPLPPQAAGSDPAKKDCMMNDATTFEFS